MAKLLIVDDSLFQRKQMAALLAELGHEPLLAADGGEGLEKCRSESPDGVFLDLLMPVKSGFEVLEALSAERLSLPVAVLSADIQASTRERCLQLGAKAFLNKPANARKVAEALETLGLA